MSAADKVDDIIKKHLNKLKTDLERRYKHQFTNDQVKGFLTYHPYNYPGVYAQTFPNGYKSNKNTKGGRHGKSRKHRSKGGRRGKSRKH